MEVSTPLTRKQQIEQEATFLFRTKGYSAASMRDLAAVMGMEAASLYSHIRSKQEILQNICFRMAGEFFRSIETITAYSPELQLEAAIKAHFKVITENIDASAVFFSEWRHLDEPALAEFLALRSQYEQYFMNIIEDGIRQKQFRPIDQKLAMMTILSSINWTHQWYHPAGKMSAEEIGDQLSKILIKGLVNTNKK